LNNGSSTATDISNSGYSSETKQKSMVYRINYGFAGKYFFEASGRYDGSYYFAPGKRFGFFPAFSAGWKISDEKFMSNISWISSLKLRGSYGESGALAGSPFQYLSSYALGSNAAILNGSAVQGLSENAEPNTSITWERAKKTDIGVEANLWNGLLTIEADYFFEKRDNMLFNPSVIVPAEYGIGLSQVNSGKMSNKGFEITLGSTYSPSKDWKIGFTGNFTYVKNKLLRVFETASTFDNPNRRITGRPLGTQFGYNALGYFTTSDDANGNGIIEASEYPISQPFGVLHPGDLKYEDTNKDGVINQQDFVPIGKSSVPQIFYGFSPSVSYKGFDFSLLFQGATNRNFYMTATAAFPFENGASATKEQMDYWTPANPNARSPRLTPTPAANNTQPSSWWILDASYLRLKTGEFGYTIPSRIVRKARMQAARVYVSGQNLLTFSPIKNFDPEVGAANGEYYPQQKVVTFGLNLTF
jgi:TonB-linked SusC/RagA family outer membrane protein